MSQIQVTPNVFTGLNCSRKTNAHPNGIIWIYLASSESSGIYAADFNDYLLSVPCVAIAPAGTCQQWQNVKDLHGHVLAFDFDFLGYLSKLLTGQ